MIIKNKHIILKVNCNYSKKRKILKLLIKIIVISLLKIRYKILKKLKKKIYNKKIGVKYSEMNYLKQYNNNNNKMKKNYFFS